MAKRDFDEVTIAYADLKRVVLFGANGSEFLISLLAKQLIKSVAIYLPKAKLRRLIEKELDNKEVSDD